MKLPDLDHPEVIYPESDGEPMAESDSHRRIMVDTIDTVKDHFIDVPDVYVSGNLFIYYVEGDPTKVVAPDFFLVRGVPKGERPIFKVWEEGRRPEIVIELTSKKTRREDLREKPAIYERLQVKEYFLFDPLGDYLKPALKGFRLEDGRLAAMETARSEGDAHVLRSEVLGLDLVGRPRELRLRDPATGSILLMPRERADSERRRAEEAEAEVERLRQQIERLRRGEDA